MKANMSKHAQVRSNQRAFSDETIALISSFGACSRRPGGTYELMIGKKELNNLRCKFKRAQSELDRIAKKRLLTTESGYIITVYNAY